MNRIIISLGAVLLFENFSYGMNVNAPDSSDQTKSANASAISKFDHDVWFKAAEDGDLDKLQSLIDKGIDVNCKDWIYTAMMCAAGAGRTSAVKLLLENNASSSGVLAFATRKGREETAKFLLDNGSTANEKWALSAAVVSRNINVVRLLLENGANPNGDGYWNTPLIIATENRDWDIFRLLLEYKADPQVRNQRGYTVWEVAEKTRCFGMVSGLIQCTQNN